MKIIIDVRDNIDYDIAMQRVSEVISGGKISRDNTLYCYHTRWEDGICVHVRDYRKNDCFVVYKSKIK
jgi:hypothetical protein